MTIENTDDNQKVMDAATDICGFAAKEMLTGKSDDEVKKELVSTVGLDEETAASVIEAAKEVIKNMRHKLEVRSLQRLMLIGGVIMVVGTLGAILFEADGAKVCCAFFALFGLKVFGQACFDWSKL